MTMNKNIQSLMEATKNEISSLRANAVKQNRKCPPFPQHIWNNIAKLMAHYSRSEVIKNLSIVESQCTRAIKKAKKSSLTRPAIKHKFVDVSSAISPNVVYLDNQVSDKKMILEIKTKNGNIISVYE